MHRAALFAAVVVSALGSAGADELATINMTAAGPDRSLPIGTDFYLAGTATKDVSEVRPIFVRYAYGVWGSTAAAKAKSCADVEHALTNYRGADGKPAVALPSDLPTGRVSVGDLWLAPKDSHVAAAYNDLHDWHAAYVTGGWKRDKGNTDDKAPFKILVPGDAFFRPGARYCLLMYTTKSVVRDDDVVVKAVKDFGVKYARCGETDQAAAHAALVVAGAAGISCRDKEIDALTAAISKVDVALSHDLRVQVEGSVNDLLRGSMQSFVLPPSLKTWSAIHGDYNVSEWHAVGGDAFAAALIAALARNTHDVVPVIEPRGGVRFYTDDGKVPIDEVMLIDDSKLRVSQEPPAAAAAHRDTIDVDLDKLPVPDFDQVSFGDLVRYSRGTITVGSKPYQLADLDTTLLKPLLDDVKANNFPAADAAIKQATDLRARIKALQELINAELKRAGASGGAAARVTSTRPSTLHANLGSWLRTVVVRPLDADSMFLVWLAGCFGFDPSGFAPIHDETLLSLDTQLATYLDAADAWKKGLASLQDELKRPESSVFSSADVKETVTQDTWFFNYVTPIAGYTVIFPHDAGSFGVAYLGVELYLYPNRVDEPMWSNGFREDLRRFVSLELAVSLQTGPFGTDGRFSGPANLGVPPFFVGAGFQVLPYVTFSMGYAFVGERKSTLAQESPGLSPSFYLGFTAQVNVPDIVMAARGRKTTTTGGK